MSSPRPPGSWPLVRFPIQEHPRSRSAETGEGTGDLPSLASTLSARSKHASVNSASAAWSAAGCAVPPAAVVKACGLAAPWSFSAFAESNGGAGGRPQSNSRLRHVRHRFLARCSNRSGSRPGCRMPARADQPVEQLQACLPSRQEEARDSFHPSGARLYQIWRESAAHFRPNLALAG